MNFVELAVPLFKLYLKNKLVSIKNKGETEEVQNTSVMEIDFNKDPLNNATTDYLEIIIQLGLI